MIETLANPTGPQPIATDNPLEALRDLFFRYWEEGDDKRARHVANVYRGAYRLSRGAQKSKAGPRLPDKATFARWAQEHLP